MHLKVIKNYLFILSLVLKLTLTTCDVYKNVNVQDNERQLRRRRRRRPNTYKPKPPDRYRIMESYSQIYFGGSLRKFTLKQVQSLEKILCKYARGDHPSANLNANCKVTQQGNLRLRKENRNPLLDRIMRPRELAKSNTTSLKEENGLIQNARFQNRKLTDLECVPTNNISLTFNFNITWSSNVLSYEELKCDQIQYENWMLSQEGRNTRMTHDLNTAGFCVNKVANNDLLRSPIPSACIPTLQPSFSSSSSSLNATSFTSIPSRSVSSTPTIFNISQSPSPTALETANWTIWPSDSSDDAAFSGTGSYSFSNSLTASNSSVPTLSPTKSTTSNSTNMNISQSPSPTLTPTAPNSVESSENLSYSPSSSFSLSGSSSPTTPIVSKPTLSPTSFKSNFPTKLESLGNLSFTFSNSFTLLPSSVDTSVPSDLISSSPTLNYKNMTELPTTINTSFDSSSGSSTRSNTPSALKTSERPTSKHKNMTDMPTIYTTSSFNSSSGSSTQSSAPTRLETPSPTMVSNNITILPTITSTEFTLTPSPTLSNSSSPINLQLSPNPTQHFENITELPKIDNTSSTSSTGSSSQSSAPSTLISNNMTIYPTIASTRFNLTPAPTLLNTSAPTSLQISLSHSPNFINITELPAMSSSEVSSQSSAPKTSKPTLASKNTTLLPSTASTGFPLTLTPTLPNTSVPDLGFLLNPTSFYKNVTELPAMNTIYTGSYSSSEQPLQFDPTSSLAPFPTSVSNETKLQSSGNSSSYPTKITSTLLPVSSSLPTILDLSPSPTFGENDTTELPTVDNSSSGSSSSSEQPLQFEPTSSLVPTNLKASRPTLTKSPKNGSSSTSYSSSGSSGPTA